MRVIASTHQEELAHMQETIVLRMNQLQEAVDQGSITSHQRHKQLQEEFGEDYQETLNQIRALMRTATKQQPQTTIIIAVAAVLFVAFIVAGLFSTNPTGLLILQPTQEIPIDVTLQPGENTLLELPEKTTIREITFTEQTTLVLEDANRQIPLYTNRCVGCGQRIHAPYLLTNTGEEATTIQTITVQI